MLCYSYRRAIGFFLFFFRIWLHFLVTKTKTEWLSFAIKNNRYLETIDRLDFFWRGPTRDARYQRFPYVITYPTSSTSRKYPRPKSSPLLNFQTLSATTSVYTHTRRSSAHPPFFSLSKTFFNMQSNEERAFFAVPRQASITEIRALIAANLNKAKLRTLNDDVGGRHSGVRFC